MPANPELLHYLKTRRSVGIAFLGEPGPTPAELEELFTIAMRVPDHGKFAPWRLVVIEGDARIKAGEKLAQIAKRNRPELEQLLSAGNVCFNLVHGAFALGYAASWVTRWFGFDTAAQEMLGARGGERFVGFVHFGTPTIVPEDRERPRVEDVVSHWED